jgi:hypothetical protein
MIALLGLRLLLVLFMDEVEIIGIVLQMLDGLKPPHLAEGLLSRFGIDDQLAQQGQYLVHGKLLIPGLFHFKGKHIVLPAGNPADILSDTAAGLLVAFIQCGSFLLESRLELAVVFRMEELLEDFFPFVGRCFQELPEISLGEHGDLTELAAVYAQDFRDRVIDLLRFRQKPPVRI